MNGMHDLGGMHGFGAIAPEADEPVFHAAWERRAFALTLAMGAWRRWNLDMSRSMREQMPPAEYLATSYYEHWLFGLERLLVEHGFATPAELAAGLQAEIDRARRDEPAAPRERARPQARPQDGALLRDSVARSLANPRGARRDLALPPRFQVGQTVRVANLHPTGHTRVPRYVRGRCGVIAIDHGVFVFADSHAAGAGEQPQHVYSVRFTARELWGPDAPPRDSVQVDLWDDHLEAAP